MVAYLESLLLSWNIHSTDVGDVEKLGVVVVFEEGEYRYDATRMY